MKWLSRWFHYSPENKWAKLQHISRKQSFIFKFSWFGCTNETLRELKKSDLGQLATVEVVATNCLQEIQQPTFPRGTKAEEMWCLWVEKNAFQRLQLQIQFKVAWNFGDLFYCFSGSSSLISLTAFIWGKRKKLFHMWSRGICWSQHILNVVKHTRCTKISMNLPHFPSWDYLHWWHL